MSARVVTLISGRGSNLQALIDAASAGTLGANLCAVISNVPGAAGLERAARAGIETATVDHRACKPRARFDAELASAVDTYSPDLIVLAGFMRVLGAGFTGRFEGRCINIHPSLLPRFPGLDTHARALAAREREHGATVHFVTEALDGGPRIAQVRVPIEPGDTEDSLAARVLLGEHVLLPEVVRWFASGRLGWVKDGPVFDGCSLATPVEVAVIEASQLE